MSLAPNTDIWSLQIFRDIHRSWRGRNSNIPMRSFRTCSRPFVKGSKRCCRSINWKAMPFLHMPPKLRYNAVRPYWNWSRQPYVAFRDRQASIKRATTCTCNACRNIPSLDLKFILHHGDYIIQHVRNITELVGSDVNLVHRLLKNRLTESTGLRAYAMLTEQCLAHLKLDLETAHVLVEEYEHLGQVKTYNLDLHQRYQEIIEERRVVVDEKDADVVFHVDFRTPPPVTWEWLQDPVRRNLWTEGVKWSMGDRPRGRAGKGASNHCAHGKGMSTEVTLDWRPFEYSTIESFENGVKKMTETLRFEPCQKAVRASAIS
jgi:hypothetical protein